jgi:hypothetical protein
MARRISSASPGERLTFAVAGDSGAWPDPTADAIFVSLLQQVTALEPAPAFFANLGDFAGPGTRERHEHYLRLVAGLPFPDVCVVGNHDLDDVDAERSWADVHGPMNFDFGCGHTRFVVVHGEGGTVGEIAIPGEGTPEGIAGPDDEDLAFLDARLAAADEPNRVVLLHTPPHLGGRYGPHPDWGFRRREREFTAILHDHGVGLVCCAHGLAFDHCVHDGVHFVMSGGGGSGLCSHFRGVCAAGAGRPEDRGALFHAVAVSIASSGRIEGRVIQAFAPPGSPPRIVFGDARPEALQPSDVAWRR